MKEFLIKLKHKEDLSFDESKSAFQILMDGKASENEIFDFLTLSELGRHVPEVLCRGRNEFKAGAFTNLCSLLETTGRQG